MSKLHAAILACAIGLSGPAFAQTTPTADQRGACGADYQKYCIGTEPGGGRVVACLNQHRDKLSAACKKAIDSRKQ
jgi:Cysteine rich repeat